MSLGIGRQGGFGGNSSGDLFLAFSTGNPLPLPGRAPAFWQLDALDDDLFDGVYQAAIEVDGDTIEDNNRAVGTVVVRGRPQVLLADNDRSHAQSLVSALRSQNIDVTVVEPAGIPKDIAGLQKYEAFVRNQQHSPYVLVLYPGVPANNIKELVALAKSKPGVLNYGSAGPASLAHLAGALFANLSEIQLTHVPYKSTAQSVVDLIAGRLEMQFATIAPTLANIQAGQLRALATTGLKRADTLPDIPTMDEAGVKGYEATLWFALMAPPGLPPAIASRLVRETGEALNSAEMKAALAQQGFAPDLGTPDALMAKIRSDIAKWREVIGKAGIKPE